MATGQYGRLGSVGASTRYGTAYARYGYMTPQAGYPAAYGDAMVRPGATNQGGRLADTGTVTKDQTASKNADSARKRALTSARRGNLAAAMNHIAGAKSWAAKIKDGSLRGQVLAAITAAEALVPQLIAEWQASQVAGIDVGAGAGGGYTDEGVYTDDAMTYDDESGSGSGALWAVGGILLVGAVAAYAATRRKKRK